MEIIADTIQFNLKKDTAAAIGKFDGIHRGHQALLANILEGKKRGLQAAVFTFDPMPSAFFFRDGRTGTDDQRRKTTDFPKTGGGCAD